MNIPILQEADQFEIPVEEFEPEIQHPDMGSDKDRQDLGLRIGKMIQAGIQERRPLEKRWDFNRRLYINDPREQTNPPYEGAANCHIPLTQVKIDALCAHVINTVVAQESYCSARCWSNPEAAPILERALHHFMKRGKYEKALRTAAPIVGWAGKCTMEHRFDLDDFGLPGVHFIPVEPQNFVVYPAVVPSLEEAILVARRFSRTLMEIKEMQDSGDYIKVDLMGGQDPGEKKEETFGGIHSELKAMPSEDDHKQVELFAFILKDKGDVWEGTIALASNAILRLNHYPMGVKFFADYQYHSEAGGYWVHGSVAQNLQGIQVLIDDLFSAMVDGQRWNSYGAFFAPGSMTAEQLKSVKPGGYIRDFGVQDMKIFSPHADLTYIQPAIQFLIAYADSVARISQLGQGGQLKKGTTATEASLLQAGQQAGIDDYIGTFGDGVERTYSIVQELLYQNWDVWYPEFGEHLGIPPEAKEYFAKPVTWELTGRSIGSNPMMLMQLAQQLTQFATIPQFRIHMYEVGKRLLQYMERTGFTNAQGLQLPEDPQELIVQIADMMQIPPELIAKHIEEAQGEAQQMQQIQELQQQVEAQNELGSLAQSLGMGAVQGGEMLPGTDEPY